MGESSGGLAEPILNELNVLEGDETQGNGHEAPAFLLSLCVHLSVLLAAALISYRLPQHLPELEIITDLASDIPLEPLNTDALAVYDLPVDQVGAESDRDSMAVSLARSAAPLVAATPEVPTPDLVSTRFGELDPSSLLDRPVGLEHESHVIVRGVGGVGTTTANGAIDQLTHEILLKLEERPTLVVWFFDQSASLNRQRKEVQERLQRVYQELGTIQSSGGQAFRHAGVPPLLSAVIAFGEQVTLRTKKPLAEADRLQAIVAEIEQDDSGIENVFQAVRLAVDRFKKYRRESPREPARNVMFIIFSDEVGDDQQLLDSTVAACRHFEIPVYTVGVPAPFGRQETLVKWVDPDPKFDQSPRWGRVSQGPETLAAERLRLDFSEQGDDLDAIDSGFGPFALTRLCVETGGIYFAVHPNRRVGGRVGRQETEPFASHLAHFFSSDVMRKYRPDYISLAEYRKRVAGHANRAALVQAAEASRVTPMEEPQTRFVKRDDAQFAAELFEAQKKAAKLEPQIERLYQLLKQGEAARDDEETPRWQAGYDLAMGRVLAVKVRTESYNLMLAQAKRGMNPKDPKDNTWTLYVSDRVSVGSQWEALANRARMYLQRVVSEHPETPWALLAEKELATPLGWAWDESYTPLDPPPAMNMANNIPLPRDDQPRMLERPPPLRPVPRL